MAAVSALTVALFAPPGGDTAAHLYRTEIVLDGVVIWDNLWFAGHYLLTSYSLLYYFPAGLIGNVPLVGLAAVVSAGLFAAVVREEWGDAARWPSLAYAVVAPIPLYTGTYSYALGVAAALGSLRLLQVRRRAFAVVCAARACVSAAPTCLSFNPCSRSC